MSLVAAGHVLAPALTFSCAASSCAASPYAASLARFRLLAMSRLLKMATPTAQVVMLRLPICCGRFPSSVCASSPLASAFWYCWPPVQLDQFFQYPIVRADPPGGGVLVHTTVFASPNASGTSTQRFPRSCGASGLMSVAEEPSTAAAAVQATARFCSQTR